jgi:serine/threonine-protein kinase
MLDVPSFRTLEGPHPASFPGQYPAEVDRYRILRELTDQGELRCNRVYLARDRHSLHRHVILKRFCPWDCLDEGQAARARLAFLREWEVLLRMSHPHIANLREVFEDEDGAQILILDYIEGNTLYEVLAGQGGALAVPMAFAVTLELCKILGYLHPRIIHRDLKPANIIIGNDGQLYLIDFGIAHINQVGQSRGGYQRHSYPSLAELASSQETFERVGSYGYAAPEQYEEDGQATVQTDLYSLGVILHQMLTGTDPTDKPADQDEVFFFDLGDRRLNLVSGLLAGLLAREPWKRPPDVSFVVRELEQALLLWRASKRQNGS